MSTAKKETLTQYWQTENDCFLLKEEKVANRTCETATLVAPLELRTSTPCCMLGAVGSPRTLLWRLHSKGAGASQSPGQYHILY